MIQYHSLDASDLERFLERHKAARSLTSNINLDLVLREILQKANEFVPAESGSILLDDPYQKTMERSRNDLVFISLFGQGSEKLLGRKISGGEGIAGRVYQTGLPHLSQEVDKDRYFLPRIDEQFGFKTHSIVGVPIYIGKDVCGVLELVNRREGRQFTERDRSLLEIFAGYTSFTLQNALDAKRAHELAKRDDLTGLFNDRWLHAALGLALQEAEATDRGFVLMFMDLDNFKTINDRHGHLAGSQVLREIGFLLTRVVQRENATISRYGGDEFVLILPDCSIECGLSVATSIGRAITEFTFLERDLGFGVPAIGLRGILSASIGVTAWEPDGGSRTLDDLKNELLRRADTAMYEAKAAGGARIVVFDGDEITVKTRSALSRLELPGEG